MSTKYFLLTKNENKSVTDNSDNQIVVLNKSLVYVLPQNDVNYYASNGMFESSLIEWCKQFCSKNKCILDIGAHIGTYTISLAKYCDHVYSFEPQKMTYYALCGGIALSNIRNVTCHNYGLGSDDQVGVQTLKIVSADGGGFSLHTCAKPVLREESVSIKTLDDFDLNDIGFIKMDVEDNERFVIMGGLKTLERSNYPKILFESNGENKELMDLLASIGYKICNICGYGNMYLACHSE